MFLPHTSTIMGIRVQIKLTCVRQTDSDIKVLCAKEFV